MMLAPNSWVSIRMIVCFLALGILSGCTTKALIQPTMDFHKHNLAILPGDTVGASLPDAYKYKWDLIDEIVKAIRSLSPEYANKVLEREMVWERLENSQVKLKGKPDLWKMPQLGKALGVDLFLFIDMHDFSGQESAPQKETHGKLSSISIEREYTIHIKAQLFDAKNGTVVWEMWERGYVTDTEVHSQTGIKPLDAIIDFINIFRESGLTQVREKCMERIADKVASRFCTLKTNISPLGQTKVNITVYSDELNLQNVVNEAEIIINRITNILNGEEVKWESPKRVFTNSEGVASLEMPEGFYQFTVQKGKRAGNIFTLVKGKRKEINIVIRQQ